MRRLLGSILVLSAVAGCGSRPVAVHYVLPEGFRGCFFVVKKPDALPIPMVGGGWWQVTVPADGVVYAADLEPLAAPRDETAMIGTTRTAAGLALGRTLVAATTVGVWVGPPDRPNSVPEYRSYFVGTEAEFAASRPEQFVLPPRP